MDGLVRRGDIVYFYIHMNVPGIGPIMDSRSSSRRPIAERDSMIVRYSLPIGVLAQLTAAAIRERDLQQSCARVLEVKVGAV